MEQLAHQITFLNDFLPYKYTIDTCSILSQKDDDTHPRSIEKSLWDDIEQMMRDHEIVISREILDEIEDEEIKKSMINIGCVVIDVDRDIQLYVKEIVCKCPKLVDFKGNKSSGDAFLIATAMKYGLVVISEENKDKPNKIPKVCEQMGVKCIDILGLCKEEEWQY